MEISFKLNGDKELIKNLRKINTTAQKRALKKSAKAGAAPVVQEAKRRVPVDTGRTKRYLRSWTARQRPGEVIESIGVTAKTRAHVARFLETGTSKMAARPFLRPAMDEMQKKAAQETNDAMVEAVLEEVRKSGPKGR